MGSHPGELEQVVMLCIAQLGDEAFVIELRRMLHEDAGRRITRGALYRTLDRLEKKGMVTWNVVEPPPDRGGHPKRRFDLTDVAVAALQNSRDVLERLWKGFDAAVGKS